MLALEDRDARIQARYALIGAAGEQIHALVGENLKLFRADETSGTWRSYIEYIDELILDGFFNAIHCSLAFLLENTDSTKPGLAPLLEAKLELQIPELVFQPSLDYGSGCTDGFYELVEGLLLDVFKMSSLVKRLAIGESDGVDHYQADLEDMLELSEMRAEIMDRCQGVITKALEYRSSFDSYAYLWVDDRPEFMRQFLLYNHVLTADELDQYGDEGVPESPPTLSHFKTQIDSYERIYADVEKVDGTSQFDVWFKVDARPFKQGLLNIIKKWSLMFKHHLTAHVTSR